MKQVKNDLEAYSYSMRNDLAEYGPLEHHLEASIKEPFLK
jgi:hypothetical protein